MDSGRWYPSGIREISLMAGDDLDIAANRKAAKYRPLRLAPPCALVSGYPIFPLQPAHLL